MFFCEILAESFYGSRELVPVVALVEHLENVTAEFRGVSLEIWVRTSSRPSALPVSCSSPAPSASLPSCLAAPFAFG